MSSDEAMRQAVEEFRTKMETSNRQFLLDRIIEIEAMNLPTEEDKLREMRTYWPGLGLRTERHYWNDCAPIGPVEQSRQEGRVTRLEEVKTLFHEYMDGVIPASLVTDEWRQMYLETMERVCNEAAAEEDGESEPLRIHFSEELVRFIKYANGVRDPNFRCSAMCGWEPVPPVGVQEYAFKDRAAEYAAQDLDISAARMVLRHYLKQMLVDEDFVLAYVPDELEVRVGFRTGRGARPESGHDAWYSAYLYCRREEDDSAASHAGWAWRIVVCSADYIEPPPPHNGLRTPADIRYYSRVSEMVQQLVRTSGPG